MVLACQTQLMFRAAETDGDQKSGINQKKNLQVPVLSLFPLNCYNLLLQLIHIMPTPKANTPILTTVLHPQT